jgi:hypothetical protein
MHEEITHIVLLSGGHSSGLVAIEVVRKHGKENVILLNHDISPTVEDIDIKRFKKDIADYCGLPITYTNINGITNPDELPDQFDVCIEAGAMTDDAGHALCTNRLKTEPFFRFLQTNFNTISNLFESTKECICYYGFDSKETLRIQRRTGYWEQWAIKPITFLPFGKKERFTTLLRSELSHLQHTQSGNTLIVRVALKRLYCIGMSLMSIVQNSMQKALSSKMQLILQFIR